MSKRYVIMDATGMPFVYDTVTGNLTWVAPNTVLAEVLCDKLNSIHRANQVAEGESLSEEAVQKVRDLIRLFERGAARFERTAEKGTPEAAAFDRLIAQEDRLTAETLKTLLLAVGIDPEG